MDAQAWYSLKNHEDIVSPSLLVYPERIQKNITTMIDMIGDVDRLRPHIKTHKTAEIIRMQQAQGIRKFKCATIPEATLLAECRVEDILLAMQPVGVHVARFFNLLQEYPNARFTTLVDNAYSIREISKMAKTRNTKVGLYLDLNTGMNRTGIVPEEEAIRLYSTINEDPWLIAKGLHTYDGHIRDTEIGQRKISCDAAFEPVQKLKDTLAKHGIPVENVIAGGSPTFPIHARRTAVEVSPGTTLLWDERYGTSFRDMKFIPAAVLLTRVISKPQPGLVCLDLGHKAIAPEMEFPRVKIYGMEHCEQVGQSEEHLVIKCPEDHHFEVGDPLYAIPMHICPTVAKYPYLLTVANNVAGGSWKVAARDH
jgi:D-serine deaminase-like pyridoxal phosphate-dependent protein